MASQISLTVPTKLVLWARSSASSSGVGSSSLVLRIETSTVAMEATVPSMNEAITQEGRLPKMPGMTCWNTNSDTLARVMPRPAKKDWARKPLASCDGGSLSEMNAR